VSQARKYSNRGRGGGCAPSYSIFSLIYEIRQLTLVEPAGRARPLDHSVAPTCCSVAAAAERSGDDCSNPTATPNCMVQRMTYAARTEAAAAAAWTLCNSAVYRTHWTRRLRAAWNAASVVYTQVDAESARRRSGYYFSQRRCARRPRRDEASQVASLRPLASTSDTIQRR